MLVAGAGGVEGFSAFEVVVFGRLGVPTVGRPAVLAKVEIRFRANLVLGLPGTNGLPYAELT
jgi:hypothetical protein